MDANPCSRLPSLLCAVLLSATLLVAGPATAGASAQHLADPNNPGESERTDVPGDGHVTGERNGPSPGRDVIPIAMTIPVVRGEYNPEREIYVPVCGHTVVDGYLVYAGLITLGYSEQRVRLLDVEPVGLPAGAWEWATGEDRVTVVFAGSEGRPLEGCLLRLVLAWRSGSGPVPIEVLSVAFNEDLLDVDLHPGAVRFPVVVRFTDPAGVDTRLERGEIRLSAYPNPSRRGSPMALTFSLAGSQPIELTLHDVGGRVLSVLASAWYPPGEHVITWNSRELDAGTYFARLRTPSSTAACRILSMP